METTNISFFVQAILKLSKLDTNTVDFIEEKTYIKNKILNTTIISKIQILFVKRLHK